jgi:outer membrane protein assembly factor BamB
MNDSILRAALLILFLQAMALAARAEDWPCWRGPQGNGRSSETLRHPETLENGAKILWKGDVGQGHSAVSIKDGLLYTLGSGTIEPGGKEHYEERVYCLDAGTGEEIWRYGYPCKPLSYNGPRATPSVDGFRLFTLGARGRLFCFDARTGEILWKKDLVSEGLAKNSPWGFGGSPVIHGDTLLLNIGAAGLALDKPTGSVIWKSGLAQSGVPTPVISEVSGTPIVLFNTEHTLYAVEIATGKWIWTHPWSYCDADPVLVGDRVFLFGGKPGNRRCRTLLDVASGKPEAVWPEREMNVAFQSWVASEGHVFGITWDKRRHRLQCIDLASGAFTWRRPIDDWGSLTMAGEYIIFIEGDGELVIFRTSPESYQEVSRARVLRMKDFDDYPQYQPNVCWTAPVLCNGRIYIRNSYGEIVCVDMSR